MIINQIKKKKKKRDTASFETEVQVASMPREDQVHRRDVKIKIKRVLPLFLNYSFKLFRKQKTRTQILCPWDISTAISPRTGISEKRV